MLQKDPWSFRNLFHISSLFDGMSESVETGAFLCAESQLPQYDVINQPDRSQHAC